MMSEKAPIKISLSTFFLVITILVIVVMGVYLYIEKTNSDKTITELEKSNADMETTIDSLQNKIDSTSNIANNSNSNNSSKSDENVVQQNETKVENNLNNEYSIEKIIIWSPDTTSYDFNTKKWFPNDSAEYYVATDKDKKLCIVDAEKKLIKKLDIVITDLISSAYVFEPENTLTVIQKDSTAYDIDITNFTYKQYKYASGY